jgi:predicted enzyme related to lactoylglutathione lyase
VSRRPRSPLRGRYPASPGARAWVPARSGVGDVRLRKLDLVEIRVRDWPAAMRWYAEVLGLSVRHVEEEEQFGIMAFPEGTMGLAIYGEPDEVVSGFPNRCYPVVIVDDLDTTLRELGQKGVIVRRGPRGGDEGFLSAIILDCEGNDISLIEWLA